MLLSEYVNQRLQGRTWWKAIWHGYIKPNIVIPIGLIVVGISGCFGGLSQAGAAFIAVSTSFFAIYNFYVQQRISRIQKIYYEDSLLDLLKHLDGCIQVFFENYIFFETAIKFIMDENEEHIRETAASYVNNLLAQMKNVAQYQSSKKEVVITLFQEKGHKIYQWADKFDKDCYNFNRALQEGLWGILNKYKSNDRSVADKKNLEDELKKIFNYRDLILRHRCLIYLLNRIIQKIGELDFKSREGIIDYVKNDPFIKENLENIDKSFKMFFGWFKLGDNAWLSYLEDQNGNRYKLLLEKRVKIEKCKKEPPAETEMKIVLNDVHLSTIAPNSEVQDYAKIQQNVVNEFPKFYPEVNSFFEFNG